MALIMIFLKKYWTHILLAVVLAAGFLYVSNLRITIEQQRTTIVTLQGENKRLQDINADLTESNADLTASLEKQTAAVNKIVENAEQRRTEATAALAAAKVETDRLKKKYAAILDVTPTATGDQCASTSILLNQYIEMRRGELQ